MLDHLAAVPGRSRSRRWSVRVLAGLVAAGVFIFGGTPVVSAAASAGNAGAEKADGVQNCQVLLGKAKSAAEGSPIISMECARDGEHLVAPASSTLLAIAFEGYNFGGGSLRINGSDGPCDRAGYGFRNVGQIYNPGTNPGYWNDRIRSWRVFNQCDYSSAFVDQDFGGYCREYKGPVADASAMDGMITSMWLSSCCPAQAWNVC
jgi:hypothetical protein